MKAIIRATAAFLLGSSVVTSLAYGEPVDQLSFQKGLAAYRHGDYRVALSLFEQAEKQGNRRPALYYNLGVCYYRLGRYYDALAQFTAAAKHKPLTAISHYNLGLVERKLGNMRQADRWFRLAAAETDDTNMRALAQRQLNPTPLNNKESRQAMPWVAGANVAVGHDDNLLDPTKQAGSSKGSSFGSVLAFASGMLSGNHDNGLRLDASGYFIRYPQQAYFDMNLLHAGLTRLQRWGRWQGEFGGGLEQDTLHGSGYLRVISAQAGVSRKLPHGTKLQLRYRYSDVSSLNSMFDPQAGSQQRFKVQLERRDAATRIRIGYVFEVNNRSNYTTPTTFTSYSPTRNMVYASGEIRLTRLWHLGGDISYRTSRYSSADTVVGLPARIIRDDKRWVGQVTLSRDMSKHLKMLAEYSHTDNHSNIAAYSYQRNVYSIGFGYLF